MATPQYNEFGQQLAADGTLPRVGDYYYVQQPDPGYNPESGYEHGPWVFSNDPYAEGAARGGAPHNGKLDSFVDQGINKAIKAAITYVISGGFGGGGTETGSLGDLVAQTGKDTGANMSMNQFWGSGSGFGAKDGRVNYSGQRVENEDLMGYENYGDSPEYSTGSSDFNTNDFFNDWGGGNSSSTGSATGTMMDGVNSQGTGFVDSGATWDQFLKKILGGAGVSGGTNTGTSDRGVDLLAVIQNLYQQNQNSNRLAQDQNTALSRGDPFGAQRPFYQNLYKQMSGGTYDWGNDPFLKNALKATNANMSAQGYNMSGNQQHALMDSAGKTMGDRMSAVGTAAGVGIVPSPNLGSQMLGFGQAQNTQNTGQGQLVGFGMQTLRDMLRGMNTESTSTGNPMGGGTPPYQNNSNMNNDEYNLSL